MPARVQPEALGGIVRRVESRQTKLSRSFGVLHPRVPRKEGLAACAHTRLHGRLVMSKEGTLRLFAYVCIPRIQQQKASLSIFSPFQTSGKHWHTDTDTSLTRTQTKTQTQTGTDSDTDSDTASRHGSGGASRSFLPSHLCHNTQAS